MLPSHGAVRAVSRFDEGAITGAYRIDFTDSAPVVVKLYQSDNAWYAAEEVHALRFLTEHGIGISPRVLAFSEFGGRSCLVCTLRPGRTLVDIGDELTSAQCHEIYRQLGEVLKRLHAIPAGGYGYFDGEIRDPLPDNSAHMTRLINEYLSEFRDYTDDPALPDRIAGHVAERSSAFAECPRPAYCHGDVHEGNLLADLGTCSLTGLLDPANMHVGDPLMDFVRLDAFSMRGNPTKIAGLLSGYGVSATGEWPEDWRPRIHLYRIALAVELYNWFTISRQTNYLPDLDRELRELSSD